VPCPYSSSGSGRSQIRRSSNLIHSPQQHCPQRLADRPTTTGSTAAEENGGASSWPEPKRRRRGPAGAGDGEAEAQPARQIRSRPVTRVLARILAATKPTPMPSAVPQTSGFRIVLNQPHKRVPQAGGGVGTEYAARGRATLPNRRTMRSHIATDHFPMQDLVPIASDDVAG